MTKGKSFQQARSVAQLISSEVMLVKQIDKLDESASTRQTFCLNTAREFVFAGASLLKAAQVTSGQISQQTKDVAANIMKCYCLIEMKPYYAASVTPTHSDIENAGRIAFELAINFISYANWGCY